MEHSCILLCLIATILEGDSIWKNVQLQLATQIRIYEIWFLCEIIYNPSCTQKVMGSIPSQVMRWNFLYSPGRVWTSRGVVFTMVFTTTFNKSRNANDIAKKSDFVLYSNLRCELKLEVFPIKSPYIFHFRLPFTVIYGRLVAILLLTYVSLVQLTLLTVECPDCVLVHV